MNLQQIAELSANYALVSQNIQRRNNDARDTLNRPTLTEYQGYTADLELHATSAGVAALYLSNAGLEANQLVLRDDVVLDAAPRRKTPPQEAPIFGADEEIWCFAFVRNYFVGVIPQYAPAYAAKLYFCSNALPAALQEPIELFSGVPYYPASTPIPVTPKIEIYLSIDQFGTIFLDAKQYKADPSTDDPLQTIGFLDTADLLHWEISNSQIRRVDRSRSWRSPFTNSPNNTPLNNGELTCQAAYWADIRLSGFEASYNLIKSRSTITKSFRGQPGADIASLLEGYIGFTEYNIDLNSCVIGDFKLNVSEKPPVIVRFTPPNFENTLAPKSIAGEFYQFQSIPEIVTAGIVI